MTRAREAGLASPGRAVAAEAARWWRSAGLFIPLLGVVVAAIQALLYLAAGTEHTWNGVLAWNVTWVTGLATPAVGLLTGMVAVRDRAGRDGGMSWRPVSPLVAAWARWCTMGAAVVAMDVLAIVPVLLVGASLGVPPVGRVAETALVVSLGGAAMLPAWDLVARRLGLFASVGFALVWGIAGVLTAERTVWWLLPFAWPVRATLRLLGTHANGTALSGDDPVAVASPLPAVLLTVLLLAVAIAVFSVVQIRVRPSAGSKRAPRRVPAPRPVHQAMPFQRGAPIQRRDGSALRAVLVSLRRTGMLTTAIVVVVVEALAALVWHRSVYSSTLFEFVTLPVAASLLPILAWMKTGPAWRVIATRPVRPGRLAVSMRAGIVLYTIGFAIVGCVIEACAGAPQDHVLRAVIITLTLGAALTSVHLWLAVRFSPVLSLAVLCVGMLLSLLTGGTTLASALWMWGPWAWAGTVTTTNDPLRMVVAWFVCVAVVIGMQPLTTRALRRHAAISH